MSVPSLVWSGSALGGRLRLLVLEGLLGLLVRFLFQLRLVLGDLLVLQFLVLRFLVLRFLVLRFLVLGFFVFGFFVFGGRGRRVLEVGRPVVIGLIPELGVGLEAAELLAD